MDKKNQASQQPLANKSNENGDKNNKTQAVCVPWQNHRISIVESFEECHAVVKELRLCCKQYNVLGIGCDFARKRNEVISLLLLSTFDGLCALIRIENIKHWRNELQHLLEDANIVKVGVGVANVCQNLINYDIYVASILDLQYLAAKCDFQIGNLSTLSATHLGVQLLENHRLEQKNWFKKKTSDIDENDRKYAAKYVLATIELFKVFKKAITGSDSTNDVRQFIDDHCSVYLNKFYKKSIFETETQAANKAPNEIRLPTPRIEIIDNIQQFKIVFQTFRKHCREYKILSFCCLRYNGTAAALGLALHNGLCIFMQFNKIAQIPDDLRQLLEDKSIVKVGVNVFSDSDRLERDYCFSVASILDLRYLAKACGYRPDKLSQLSKEHLQIDLDEDDWRLSFTNWRSKKIRQYAIKHVTKRLQVSIELFEKFRQKLGTNHNTLFKFITNICQPYLNEDYPKRKAQNFTGKLPEQDIRVVNNADECKAIVQELRMHCKEYNVLGLDCEWLPRGQKKVAMLQLATYRGLCALIRLYKLKQVPKELRELMKDEKILKVGVSVQQDAKKLKQDYQLIVNSTKDLVHLAKRCKYKAKGLAGLTEEVLNIQLTNKKRGLATLRLHKKWENDTLPQANIEYAANDVHVSIEIFKKIEEKLMANELTENGNRLSGVQTFIDKYCLPHSKNK